MSFGYKIEQAPTDEIFAAAALADIARKAGLKPIDGTIGVITESGDPKHPTVLPCVQKVVDSFLQEFDQNPGFPYSPLLGVTAYRDAMKRLVFGEDTMVASIATEGGTAAVRLNLDLAKVMKIKRVILPVPTWPNHLNLLDGSGLPYTTIAGEQLHPPTPEQLLDEAHKQSDPALFLLQANAHNPTGHQWSREQWQVFAEGLSGSSHIVLLDCAYMGLSEGVAEDRIPALLLQEAGVHLLFAGSCSKNHGLYGLRVGWASAVVSSAEDQKLLEDWYRILTRRVYSTASTFGQLIVAKVQSENADEWCTELGTVRTEIDQKRQILLEAFPEWSDSLQGTGLFTILPLDLSAVERLREDNVYLTNDARLNLAGIPLDRYEELIQKIKKVM